MQILLLSVQPRTLISRNFSLGNRPREMANKDKDAASMPALHRLTGKESCRVCMGC